MIAEVRMVIEKEKESRSLRHRNYVVTALSQLKIVKF